MDRPVTVVGPRRGVIELRGLAEGRRPVFPNGSNVTSQGVGKK